MLETIDPFHLKQLFDYYNFLAEQVGDLKQDIRFLRVLRKALLPPPIGGGAQKLDPVIFPPFQKRPHPTLAGKRVGLVASGGSGALVTLCGVKRALEEADIDVAAISVCSGSAIWGSMIAAGLSAQQMVETCFAWQPKDLVDVDWAKIASFGPTLGKGFAGLAKGEAIEKTLDKTLHGMTLGDTKIPYYAIVLNIDTNETGYFGPHNRPEVRLATMARIAIALPLFVAPVKVGECYYVDGGVVDIFPVAPLLTQEKPFDALIGVNVIMPEGFAGEKISGWLDAPISLLKVTRQLYHAQWLELAKRQRESAGTSMVLLEPLPYTEIHGSKFFEIFLSNAKWPEHILKAYYHTRQKLEAVTELGSR